MSDENTANQAAPEKAPQATISMPQVSTVQLAQYALNVFSKSSIAADEESLIFAMQLRAMLGGLASGQLIVGRPEAASQVPPPSLKAVKK
jgi:hypothetical protein